MKIHLRLPKGLVAASLAAGSAALAASAASAQTLTISPVTVQMAPGQGAAALTVINQADTPAAVQVRVYAWRQPDSAAEPELVETSATVLASPPLATIAPSAAQVVRLVLRETPQNKEAAYRILIDQIPAPAEPGTVRMALRLSIPVFAEPRNAVSARLKFQLQKAKDGLYLVAVNEGGRHETLRDVTLTLASGARLAADPNASPYVLAGATRRWRLTAPAGAEPAGPVRFTARGEAGPIDQMLAVAPAAP